MRLLKKDKEHFFNVLGIVDTIILIVVLFLVASCASSYSVRVSQSQPDQLQQTTIETTTTISGADFFKK